jgi:hypothetical protein
MSIGFIYSRILTKKRIEEFIYKSEKKVYFEDYSGYPTITYMPSYPMQHY